jgi:hypothetical protein
MYSYSHGTNIRMGGHGEKMLGEHCRIRNEIKSTLLKDGIRNMRVMDTLGSLTSKSTIAEQLAARVCRQSSGGEEEDLSESGQEAAGGKGSSLSKEKMSN